MSDFILLVLKTELVRHPVLKEGLLQCLFLISPILTRSPAP